MTVGAIEIRALRPADLDRIMQLEKSLFDSHAWSRAMLLEELADRHTRWYIAAETLVEDLQQVVGYAGLAVLGDEGHVMTIGTDEQWQGQGIGRTLLRALIAEAEARGVRQMVLEVRADNAPAIALYESEDFTQVGVRRGYYQPEGVDAVVMIRG